MPTDSLPVPAFATEGSFNGAFEARIDLAEASVRDALRDRFGRVEVDVLRLDDGAGWSEVEAFYTQAFAEAPLAEAGFERQPTASGDPDAYRLAVWARDRRTQSDEALAVAVVPGRPDDPLSFLLLVHTP